MSFRNIQKIEAFSAHFARLGDLYILSHIDTSRKPDTKTASSMPGLNHPLRLNGLLILLVDEGAIDLYVNTGNHTITVGDMTVIKPGTLISFTELAPDTRFTLLFISISFLNSVNIDLHNINIQSVLTGSQPIISLDADESALIRKYFELLTINAADPTPSVFATRIAGTLIASVTYEMLRFAMNRVVSSADTDVTADTASQTRAATYVHRFMQLLHLHYANRRNLDFYARQLCITPKYLSMITKEITGNSASEWLNRVVILEAKNLLRFSDKSIQQVAYALNFPSQSAFGKYFKRFTGQSPTEYIKNPIDQ